MKKVYEKPVAERVDFNFSEQIVAASGAQGNFGNNDNSGKCYQATIGCSTYPY